MNEYSTHLTAQYQKDLDYCRQFLFGYGSNYTFATRLFPQEVRDETLVFYSLLRYTDELVDNPEADLVGQTHTSLDEVINEWNQVIATQQVQTQTHPIIRANYYLFAEKDIPFDYVADFFTAMKQDLEKSRYNSYRELVGYMWGSASIVGHVMTHIIGYTDSKAFDHAQALGEAMQLANFLRDIDEDYQKRDRIYLPQQDMNVFGVTEDMIANRTMTEELRNLIRHYVERTETLFQKGEEGIEYLKKGHFSIRLASRIYAYNLRILKQRNYNPFGKPISVSKLRKAIIFFQTLFS